jgi:hypothetical protein
MVKPILLFFVPICGFCIAKRTAKIGTEPELPSPEIKKRQAYLIDRAISVRYAGQAIGYQRVMLTNRRFTETAEKTQN